MLPSWRAPLLVFEGIITQHNRRHSEEAIDGQTSDHAAGDRASKVMATRLTIFGFVVIDEVQADGTVRRLRPSEAFHASTDCPWRISKPSSRYKLDDEWRETDRDLFAALQA